MLRRLPLLIAVLMIASASAALADPSQSADTSLPFRHVTLYTSGVGFFQRSGQIDGDATTTLYFPLDEVNDVLKSLVLVDEGGGSIQPVTYAAKDPVARQLQAFSVDLSDNPDRETLFSRLRGAHVTVTLQQAGGAVSNAGSLSGVVMGVEEQVETVTDGQSPAGSTRKSLALNLLADDGIHSIPFDQIGAFKIDDPQLDSEVREALETVSDGRDANKRPVKLTFQGTGKRTVEVGYVAESPVWQSTYRLVLGKSPVLQGWALVQNTSQDDWNGIDLTLVSGRPVSFTQDLYTPLYVARPNVQSQLEEALNPVSYQEGMQPEGTNEYAASSTLNAPVAATPPTLPITTMTPMNRQSLRALIANPVQGGYEKAINGNLIEGKLASANVGASGARLGEALFTYNIDIPVTIPRQQSAMIPFMSSHIEAERVGIYNADVNADHPMSGARIKNTSGLHLLGGPITVFDEGAQTSYVGDALMDDTQDGETRLISYALDSAVLAQVTGGDQETTTLGLKIVDGVLSLQVKDRSDTTYTLRNHGADDQTIVVEHPDPGGDWKIVKPATYSEHTDTVYRFDVPVPAGKAATLDVVAEQTEIQTVGLAEDTADDILLYVKEGGDLSPGVAAALQEVVNRKHLIADLQAKLANLESQISDITDSQERIRDNMKVLAASSALYVRYVGELDAQETKLNDINTQKDNLNNELAADQASLKDYLSTLTVGDLPASTTGN